MAISHNFENVSPVAVLASRVAARVQDVLNRYKVWRLENATRAALMRLSDAELADIGLSRYEIGTLDLSRNA